MALTDFIEKMLVLSTGHISETTMKELPESYVGMTRDNQPDWWPTFARDEGWVFYIYEDATEVWKYAPKDLVACIEFARQRGCKWLMLDCDGAQVPELPFHVW